MLQTCSTKQKHYVKRGILTARLNVLKKLDVVIASVWKVDIKCQYLNYE